MTRSRPAPPKKDGYTHIILRLPRDTLAEEVRQGLTASPRTLPCKFFYDARGLALFDQICQLPEYYLTRTETDILRQYASDIIGQCPRPLALAELGSGSALKTRLLIEPCVARQEQLTYYAVDILPSALEESGWRLREAYPGLRVVGLAGEFADGLAYLAGLGGEPRLLAFLGSTVGNFTEEENERFFTLVRQALRPEDRLLLGADLAKDPALLTAAYDDSQGVTAQFNKNLLARINRELAADFDLDAFAHQAIFNAAHSRIEMHLVSLRAQVIRVGSLGLTVPLQAGEMIHTENCYKHSRKTLEKLLARHGFGVTGFFSDPRQWFGLFLAS